VTPFDYSALEFERHGHVALATLNRPETLNALNPALRTDLLSLARDIQEDDEIRVLVLTGAGRGFCSGADMSSGGFASQQETQNDRLDELEGAGRRALALSALDKPVIGAINGVCGGAGMSLALSCDLRVGTLRARFATLFVDRGLSPDSGLSYFLPRIVGYSRAMDLILTGRFVDADEAYRLGLLDRLLGEGENLVASALHLANDIASKPPLAVRSSKRVVQHNVDSVLHESLRHETFGLHFAKKAVRDSAEAIASFREKRPPTYTGE
jgi:2-(1,2-epoxy-1,2-dihydrophenyl)acetyl-CoA isomerase